MYFQFARHVVPAIAYRDGTDYRRQQNTKRETRHRQQNIRDHKVWAQCKSQSPTEKLGAEKTCADSVSGIKERGRFNPSCIEAATNCISSSESRVKNGIAKHVFDTLSVTRKSLVCEYPSS